MPARAGRALLVCVVALFVGLIACPASADRPIPPEPRTYVSVDGQVRLVVTPVRGRSGAARPTGSLQRRGSNGVWQTIWQGPLANRVAPARALVANSGDRFVTFDDWERIGHGDHVVVIYKRDGQILRSFSLTDLLPADYVAALPRTISSIFWGTEHRISEDTGQLILGIVIPTRDERYEPETIDLVIDLATGRHHALSGPDWERARATAARLSAERLEARRAGW